MTMDPGSWTWGPGAVTAAATLPSGSDLSLSLSTCDLLCFPQEGGEGGRGHGGQSPRQTALTCRRTWAVPLRPPGPVSQSPASRPSALASCPAGRGWTAGVRGAHGAAVCRAGGTGTAKRSKTPRQSDGWFPSARAPAQGRLLGNRDLSLHM